METLGRLGTASHFVRTGQCSAVRADMSLLHSHPQVYAEVCVTDPQFVTNGSASQMFADIVLVHKFVQTWQFFISLCRPGNAPQVHEDMALVHRLCRHGTASHSLCKHANASQVWEDLAMLYIQCCMAIYAMLSKGAFKYYIIRFCSTP